MFTSQPLHRRHRTPPSWLAILPLVLIALLSPAPLHAQRTPTDPGTPLGTPTFTTTTTTAAGDLHNYSCQVTVQEVTFQIFSRGCR
jgi:hypothetical protein